MPLQPRDERDVPNQLDAIRVRRTLLPAGEYVAPPIHGSPPVSPRGYRSFEHAILLLAAVPHPQRQPPPNTRNSVNNL